MDVSRPKSVRPGSNAVLHMRRIEFNELSSCDSSMAESIQISQPNSDLLSRYSHLTQPGITAVDQL